MRLSLPKRFLRDRKGGTAIEYGLIASLITIGLIGAMTLWGQEATGMYGGLSDAWPSANASEDAGDAE